MRVALFHPYLKSRGGAERVVWHLVRYAKLAGVDVDLYTLYYDQNSTFDFERHVDVHILAPHRLSSAFARRYYSRGLYFTLLARSARIPNIEDYDALLVSVSGIGATIAHKNAKIPTFAYVHTPLRAAGTPEDLAFHLHGRRLLGRLAHLAAAEGYRRLVRGDWRRFDGLIYNSQKTAARVRWLGYVGDDAREAVLTPPIDDWALTTEWRGGGGYYLYFSRFAHAKRQLEVVQAWLRSEAWLYKDLYLVGQPSDPIYAKAVLNRIAGLPPEVKRTVHVIFDAPDEEIAHLHRYADLVFFSGWAEDYGIAPLDAAVIGAPTVIPSSTGALHHLSTFPNVFVYSDHFEPRTFVEELANVLKLSAITGERFIRAGRKSGHDAFAMLNAPDRFAMRVWEQVVRWVE